MSFPAYDAFAKDAGLTLTRWRVYMTLQPPFLDFVQPRDVKIILLDEALRFRDRTHRSVGRQHIREAINWLVARGFLIEHGRNPRGVRSLTIAYALPEGEPHVSRGVPHSRTA